VTTVSPVELENFRLEDSDNPNKTDIELHCKRCKTHLCDLEGGDEVTLMFGVMVDHVCETWKIRKG